VRQVGY